MKYILVGQTAVPCDNTREWAKWFEHADRVVAKSEFGDMLVSTVFLGLDHDFSMQGPPLLFETMIFRAGQALDYQERCSTWLEAEEQHERGILVAMEKQVLG